MLVSVLDGPAVAAGHDRDRLAVDVLGQERQRRCDGHRDQRVDLVRDSEGPVAVEGKQVLGLIAGVEDRAAVDHRAVLVQAVLECRHDAEVSAAAAQRPEQVWVLILAGAHEVAIGGDDVRRDEVVAGEPAGTGEMPDPAAEREPGDARRRDQPAGHGEAERLRLPVEAPHFTPPCARAVRAAGSTCIPCIGERSMTIPSSTVENPAIEWPPPRTAIVIP
jgi:hypothetical protein